MRNFLQFWRKFSRGMGMRPTLSGMQVYAMHRTGKYGNLRKMAIG